MKVGVIKLGSRISFDSLGTSGGTGETVSIIKMIVGGGADVVAFSKVIRKESPNPIPGVTVLDLVAFKDQVNDMGLDCLCVLNGRVNYFGGVDDPYQTLNYHIINNFNGRVYYIYCDPDLTLTQIWPNVSKKEWGSRYKQEDIEITRKDIVYISQPLKTDLVKNEVLTGANEVIPEKIIHFPFEKFPCLHDIMQISEKTDIDLSYGGTMRGGRRMKKMINFYFGHSDISVEMFGKIEESDFKKKLVGDLSLPNFGPSVNYAEMHSKMNRSLAHCVIGDPIYEKLDDIPQRCYESIWSSCVTFIDADMDSARRVYGTGPIADFFYVKNREELSKRILSLKNPIVRRRVINTQFELVNFDAKRYCAEFVELLSIFKD